MAPGDHEWPTDRLSWAPEPLLEPPPLSLWVRGAHRLDEAVERSVAVVGARAATRYGAQIATDWAAGLAERDTRRLALELSPPDSLGLSLRAVCDLEPYWEAVRHVYRPFESGLPGPTGRVYKHEIPGGQLSNLRQQAIALGLADQFEKVEDWYAAANRILGRPPKVTPSSKVVGDLALALAAANADPDDFEQNPQKYDIPASVIGFMAGELGELPGGWPEPFRSKVLAGRDVKIGIEPITAQDQASLNGESAIRRATLNRLLFPGPTAIFEQSRETYGDLSVLETTDYLYGLRQGTEHIIEMAKGVSIFVGLEAIGENRREGGCHKTGQHRGPVLGRRHAPSGGWRCRRGWTNCRLD